ncbi:expressed unknown protein [Seminavis robusta]|uniref:Uncharacterized protein n=1 Tax=Seminavis robusta TaxID=568900 RepID=A0A9N8I1G0_9STRA|nr:expressed unknown protein [Seminavis robusta]|eukprot:Sro3545_g349110.1 n/a (190) ;mRNA; r:2214-2783
MQRIKPEEEIHLHVSGIMGPPESSATGSVRSSMMFRKRASSNRSLNLQQLGKSTKDRGSSHVEPEGSTASAPFSLDALHSSFGSISIATTNSPQGSALFTLGDGDDAERAEKLSERDDLASDWDADSSCGGRNRDESSRSLNLPVTEDANRGKDLDMASVGSVLFSVNEMEEDDDSEVLIDSSMTTPAA